MIVKAKLARELQDCWGEFLRDLAMNTEDTFLVSIFAQSRVTDLDAGNLCVEMNSNSKFFQDKLEESMKQWIAIFSKHFPEKTIKFYVPSGMEVKAYNSPTVVTSDGEVL
jgi:hypothetical protein